jgi:hypothetical protein
MFDRSIYHLVAISFLLLSCVPKDAGAQQLKTVQGNGQHINIKKMAPIDTLELKKISPEKAIAKFSKPLKDEYFNLSEPLPEFRVEIYNTVPEKNRHSAAMKFRELTWVYDKSHNITVWYQAKQNQWVFVNFRIWPNDAVF